MNALTVIALLFLLAVALVLAAAAACQTCRRNLAKRKGAACGLAVLAAVCALVAQKNAPKITFDILIADAGSYATNDVLHVAATNAPAYAAIDFSAQNVLVYARQRDSTNAADWVELTPRRVFGDLPADYAIVNATNYNYMVYLDYIPPSPVHTNGVFELTGFTIGETPQERAAGFINSRPELKETP